MNKNYIKLIFVRHGESTENIAKYEGKSYDKENIILTKRGIYQAIFTGKYLKNVYKKFDKIYTSPAKRCIETSNAIAEQIKYNKELIEKDNLLIEIGYYNNKMDGLSEEENQVIIDEINKNKKIINLNKKFVNTIDPFERYIINKKRNTEYIKIQEIKPSSYEVMENCNKFLEKIKKSNDPRAPRKFSCGEKNILIITHGGIIDIFQRIVCNIDIEVNPLYISPNKDNNNLKGNCCILCIGIINNEFKLICPANVNHFHIKT